MNFGSWTKSKPWTSIFYWLVSLDGLYFLNQHVIWSNDSVADSWKMAWQCTIRKAVMVSVVNYIQMPSLNWNWTHETNGLGDHIKRLKVRWRPLLPRRVATDCGAAACWASYKVLLPQHHNLSCFIRTLGLVWIDIPLYFFFWHYCYRFVL